MRAILLASALLLSFPIPAVEAAHYGPCTHEWFEIAAYVAGGGDPSTAVGYAGWCAGGTAWWACRAVRCEELIA